MDGLRTADKKAKEGGVSPGGIHLQDGRVPWENGVPEIGVRKPYRLTTTETIESIEYFEILDTFDIFENFPHSLRVSRAVAAGVIRAGPERLPRADAALRHPPLHRLSAKRTGRSPLLRSRGGANGQSSRR